MYNKIAVACLYLLIISPIILLNLKSRDSKTWGIVVAFFVFFIFNQLLVFLPIVFEGLRLLDGSWNWTGKLYAILGSFLFIAIYGKFDRKDYFLTFKQNKEFTKYGILIVLSFSACQALVLSIFSTPKAWDWETIFFQMTMPGLEEEIAYRGIMLGLMSKALTSDFKYFKIPLGNPSIWITSILFGLVHSLFLTDTYQFVFHFWTFISSSLYGAVWAWLTLKSGSILLAVISHNLSNTVLQLMRMR